MSLTVRLSAKAERALNALAKRRRQTRSDIVREAIERYTATSESGTGESTAYDDWADVIGIGRSGARNPRKTTGEQFTDIVRVKARTRRAR